MKRKSTRSKKPLTRGVLPAFTDLRRKMLRQFETDYVWQVLIQARGNMSLAARMARIDRKHLWRLMQRTGIRVQQQKLEAAVRRARR